ncbi:MAG: sn-glycerol-3-phosphate ABC transporter ATP-binding protein UgpC [Sporomusaceae bacterium]|nr:sn-glycerol-3-phosphate ABC transporter ATP-binding protein UgpC [Sporomusaceae bacterium]
MGTVVCEHLRKEFSGGVVAVDDFHVDFGENEFVVIVGPSGCGKSTTLRMIAGLEERTAGNIYIQGRLVNDEPPRNRNIAMVFQNYALYPHMNVYENMAFGLKLNQVPKSEIEQRVREAADILGISGYLARKPKELSGGQRQRVALGRAIVRNPSVFLMDEPLSNLDAKLRVQMRAEIIKLHRRIGVSTIYVTHDQTEAMTMADRIIVMKDGFVHQIASPQDLYDKPVNRFVAGFIGTPPMNFLDVSVTGLGEGLVLTADDVAIPVPDEWAATVRSLGLQRVTLGVRAENACPAAEGTVRALVEVVEPLGSENILSLKAGGQPLLVRVSPDYRPAAGSVIGLTVEMAKAHLFDYESGHAYF